MFVVWASVSGASASSARPTIRNENEGCLEFMAQTVCGLYPPSLISALAVSLYGFWRMFLIFWLFERLVHNCGGKASPHIARVCLPPLPILSVAHSGADVMAPWPSA